MNDFIFKWTVLIKSLALNFLRNLAIVKNRSRGATSEKYKPDINLFKNKKNLCIARMALAYLNPLEIEIFLSKLYSSNVDIAISDVGRFRLNKDSKVSYTQSGVSVFSHPYEKFLSRIGYSIVIDMQKITSSYEFYNICFRNITK